MKYLFLCVIISLLACSKSPDLTEKIAGRWKLNSIHLENTDISADLNPSNDRWIEFFTDGNFKSGGSIGPNDGSFILKDNKLSLDSNAGEGDDSDWTIMISADTLIMTGIGSERQKQSRVVAIRTSTAVPGISITSYPLVGQYRALEVVDESTVWYAGSNGQYGFTEDAGATWRKDSIEFEGMKPAFRSMAITADAVFLMSIASPALLFKSIDKGQNWELVYRDDHPDIFYDAMDFIDDQRGIVAGDYLDGCISVLLTEDGGNTWTKIPCDQLPEGIEGEGFFASSDTNIEIVGENIWIGSTKSRVYHSPDAGGTWSVTDTPIIKGGQMTGIFTMAFADDNNGIVFGGDWIAKENNSENKAITKDGGKTWELVSNGVAPAFRSCVQYIPQSNGMKLFAVGIPGISYSADAGQNWVDLSNANFYTLRFTPSGKVAWMAGANKIARMNF